MPKRIAVKQEPVPARSTGMWGYCHHFDETDTTRLTSESEPVDKATQTARVSLASWSLGT